MKIKYSLLTLTLSSLLALTGGCGKSTPTAGTAPAADPAADASAAKPEAGAAAPAVQAPVPTNEEGQKAIDQCKSLIEAHRYQEAFGALNQAAGLPLSDAQQSELSKLRVQLREGMRSGK
jgi:hypothetical protein